jgi:small redox-active disulfide protein 2
MKDIKVLGTGCANCKNTIALVDTVARERGVEIHLEKVEDIKAIMGYGVMSTPGVVIDGQVVHAGGVPSRQKVEGWFTAVMLVLMVLFGGGVAAAQAGGDLERQALQLETKLMATCCFAQQVSVHPSAAAQDAKLDIRRRLTAGESERQILAAYVAQYGKQVLAEPPAEGFDISLYVMPFVLLVGGFGVVVLLAKRFTNRAPLAMAGDPGLSAGVAQRLDDELRDLD